MAKLKLVANPTFQAKVGIPVAGGDAVEVVLTFKHRTKSALDQFVQDAVGKPDADSFLAMVTAWDLEDEFNRENVETLLENYQGAGREAFKVYMEQLIAVKLGN